MADYRQDLIDAMPDTQSVMTLILRVNQNHLKSLPLVFQPGQSGGLNAVYHFSFSGAENLEGTVIIREKSLAVREGLEGKSDLHVTADSQTWIKFLAKEINIVKALLTRKIRIKGSAKLMMAFAKCFPS